MPDVSSVGAPKPHRHRRDSVADGVVRQQMRTGAGLLVAALAGGMLAAAAVGQVYAVPSGWLAFAVASTVCAAGVVALLRSWASTRTVVGMLTRSQHEDAERLVTMSSAVEKSVLWSADEVCRGGRPPLPEAAPPVTGQVLRPVEAALGELQFQAVAALIRVRDEAGATVLLEVLRLLSKRENALVQKSLGALSELEKLTDDPDLLKKIWQLDHLVTRIRRLVESIAVLGGESLRSTRHPVSVSTVLRGAASEVAQYPRVRVAARSVGATLALPGHVGPDLTHVLAELIENSLTCSDPSTVVHVRAQAVPAGLAIEVEDRAVAMDPRLRERLNHLLAAPDEVDVSERVRGGQIGLLTAAKIGQRHGLSIRLAENPTGGTTALVVVPARNIVTVVPPTEEAPLLADGAESATAERDRPPVQEPQPAAAAAGQVPPAAGVPPLPRRARGQMPSRAAGERPLPPQAAARTGVVSAFRSGMGAAHSPRPLPPDGPAAS